MEYITVENFVIVSISEFGIIVTLGIMMFTITGKLGTRVTTLEANAYSEIDARKDEFKRVWDEIGKIRDGMDASIDKRNADNMIFAEALGKFNLAIGEFRSSMKSIEETLVLMRTDFKDTVNEKVGGIEKRLDREERIRNGAK